MLSTSRRIAAVSVALLMRFSALDAQTCDPVHPLMMTTHRSIVVNGVPRTYLVAVPCSYSPAVRLDLVFVWHGSTGAGADSHAAQSGLEYYSQGRAIFVYPDGLPILGLTTNPTTGQQYCGTILDIPVNAGGPALTSARPGMSCVGWDWRPNGRDIAFFDALLDPANPGSVVANYNVNGSGVASLGFSSGGWFTSNLVCNRSSVIKAAVVMSGGIPAWVLPGRNYPGQDCLTVNLLYDPNAGLTQPGSGTDVTAFNPPAGCPAHVAIMFTGNTVNDSPYSGCATPPGLAIDFWKAQNRSAAAGTAVTLPADAFGSQCVLFSGTRPLYSCTFTSAQSGHSPPPPTSSLQRMAWDFIAEQLHQPERRRAVH
jgi:poly(3-hydroxybutyrate) depolymerase